MNKIYSLIILCAFLTSCNSFGTKKVKTIVELTPKLTRGSHTQLILNTKDHKIVDFSKSGRKKTFALTKNSLISEPAMAKGSLYSVDNKGFVSEFSLESKKTIWTQSIAHGQFDPNFAAGGIVYNNNKLYITNGSRYLIILDSTTGYEILRKEFADIIRTKPLLLNDHEILVQTITNQIFVYNTLTAKTFLWNETVAEILSSANHVNPLIYDNKVIAFYNSGLIIALNSKNGETLWELNIGDIREEGSGEDARIVANPILSQGNLYIASNSGKLYKIKIDNGNIIWTKNASDVVSMSIDKNHLFITNNARQVAVYNMNNGEIEWVGQLNNGKKARPKPEFFLPPFLTQDINGNSNLVVIGASGNVYSFITKDHILSDTATVVPIYKNIRYKSKACCSSLYLLNDKQIIFIY